MDNAQKDPYSLKDGRSEGCCKTRYGGRAWVQVIIEYALLTSYLCFANYLLLNFVLIKSIGTARTGYVYSSLFDAYILNESAQWVALALAGFIGGTVFDLKWLYHSVAKGLWNVDRCLWKIIVPFNSAMVFLFTGFFCASGVVSLFKSKSFENIYALLGLGFVFGYFSDNLLAALQNLAKQTFGTLKDG